MDKMRQRNESKNINSTSKADNAKPSNNSLNPSISAENKEGANTAQLIRGTDLGNLQPCELVEEARLPVSLSELSTHAVVGQKFGYLH
jgi:hypothetical protein